MGEMYTLIGKEVLIEPCEGDNRYIGTINGIDNNFVYFESDGLGRIVISIAAIKHIKLDYQKARAATPVVGGNTSLPSAYGS